MRSLLLTLWAPLAFGASGTLQNPAQPALWFGSVTSGAGPASEIPECKPGCQRFDLTINLPVGVWIEKPGGVQIAIRWISHTLGDNLRLYVYQGSALIAKSDGIIATAQSVLIPNAANGAYRIYVAHDPDSPNPTVPYDGLAEVEYTPNLHPLRRMLPDLVVRSQRNVSFDPTGIFFDEISAEHPTCYESEVAEENARTCLRFDQIFANVGEAPMELRFAVPSAQTPPTVPVVQRIRRSDGTAEDRQAGEVVFHPVHGHYHFSSFGVSRLWKVDSAGNRQVGNPLRQSRAKRAAPTLARTGKKVSFCLADIEIDFWGKKGDGPRTYKAPDCLFPAQSDAAFDYFVQGITNGWADVYDWYLPDQYIEVTGVVDGVYILDTIADPDKALLEADDQNNCGAIYVRLSDMSTHPKAQILGPGPACSSVP